LSVPFRPRLPVRPTTAMPQSNDEWFYQLYFQKLGVAEAELERDVRVTVRTILYTLSGEGPRGAHDMVPRGKGVLSRLSNPSALPRWLSERDIDLYEGEFKRTGFRGGLNWYRNIDLNWELLAPYAGGQVTVPALYVAGDRDLVVSFKGMDQLLPNLEKFAPNLRKKIMLPGCGHWTQQERPEEVNAAIVSFLREL
jgi:pimeloyl-ACP methyl ester carboxylesterase